MSTLLIALASFFGFIVAYNTYGKFLADKLFQLKPDEPVPSVEHEDGIDFVPTNRYVIFGHHFTTIAGTGPIVGPAIAVMWGWLPALLWVVFGCIFIGAVHDFTALVMSLRHQGKSLGEIAGKVLSPSSKLLLLFLLCFLLAIVVAVFANVIAITFKDYPQSVIPSIIAIPIAMGLGLATRRYGVSLKSSSILALLCLGGFIVAASEWPSLTFTMPDWSKSVNPVLNPTMLWTWTLLIYCYFASVLPVWLLLQPRDYVNSLVLYVTMTMIVVGLVLAGFSGQADMLDTAPALRIEQAAEAGAPPILPFLFITVACGAVSGFHALASSGTTSKQVASMTDARFVGYGAMLLEGVLAVIVIISCTAGLGLGIKNVTTSAEATGSSAALAGAVEAGEKPETVYGREAWNLRYNRKWSQMNLGEQVGVFIEGGANFIRMIGIPVKIGQGLIAILIACFAATTIDSALRLFRYVLQELGGMIRLAPMKNRYFAAAVGLVLAGALALCKANPTAPYGTGGMILWPLFGAGNQVVAGLTLLVGTVYLMRRKAKTAYLMLPAVVMIIIPLWAMTYSIFFDPNGFIARKNALLIFVGLGIILLACWLVVEAYRVTRRLVEYQKEPTENAPDQ